MAVTSKVREGGIDGCTGGAWGQVPRCEPTLVVQKLWKNVSSDMMAMKERERMLLVGLSADLCSCAMQHQARGRVQSSMLRKSLVIWDTRVLYNCAGGQPPLALTINIRTSGGMVSICGTVALVSLGSCASRMCCEGLVERVNLSELAM